MLVETCIHYLDVDMKCKTSGVSSLSAYIIWMQIYNATEVVLAFLFAYIILMYIYNAKRKIH